MGRWWHAYGRIREDLGAHQLTVIHDSPVSPRRAAELAAGAWGDYLTSWDHDPTEAERDAAAAIQTGATG